MKFESTENSIERNAELRQVALIAGVFGLPMMSILIIALDARAAQWALLIGQIFLAGVLMWMLRRSIRRAHTHLATLAQESLVQLERLSVATQSAGIYCWELDWKTYAITWDKSRLPAAEAAAASRRHFGAELGSDLFKWVHPDDKGAGGEAMSMSLARGEDHVSFRYRLVLPDQSIRHVQAFARTYCDEAGKPQRSLGVSWDVTAEVEAAELAARNAANERAMLERLSVATQAAGLKCWEYDFRQNMVVWLDQGPEQQPSTPLDIAAAGSALFDQILPEDLVSWGARLEEAAAQHDPILSHRVRRRSTDGTLQHLQIYLRLFYDEAGKQSRALGTMLDITESFKRQAELETLSMRFGIATRAANAGVWEHRAETGEIWWNETMYAIYGCQIGTFQPSLEAAVAMIHPDDLGTAQAAWDNALGGSNQLHVQFRIIRPDGRTAHLDSLATVVAKSDGSDPRLVGISLDISERVAAEQRERQLQKQLREASHQSGMAEVATGVLHNVGNVLNSLGVTASTGQMRMKARQVHRVGQIAAMLEENRGALADFLTKDDRGKRVPEYLASLAARLEADADSTRKDFDAIDGHVQYLRQIVQAQQSFARMGGAHDEVDVGDLLETALTLKAQDLKGIDVARDLGDLPIVRTDRYKLLQIIVNFLSNAYDAVVENGSAEPRIMLRVRTVLDKLEIAVEDSGIGIAPEVLERVWEFGFTTKTHGHGFGLHSAAVAAQQLGGSISADSRGVGQGARFTVTIPINPPARVERVSAA
jgi:signal transduction histidine kinase